MSIKLGDLLDLLDEDRSGTEGLRIVGPEEEFKDGFLCMSDSWVLGLLKDWPVQCMATDKAQEQVIVICLDPLSKD